MLPLPNLRLLGVHYPAQHARLSVLRLQRGQYQPIESETRPPALARPSPNRTMGFLYFVIVIIIII
jgi:hypothetical protein